MTWRYSGDPTNNDKDKVRFQAGLTDSSDQILSDEEIKYLISSTGSVLSAASAACERVATIFSRKADAEVGDASVKFSQIASNYSDRADELASRAGLTAPPIVGGKDKSDKESYEDKTDRVEPSFRRGMFDNRHGEEQAGD